MLALFRRLGCPGFPAALFFFFICGFAFSVASGEVVEGIDGEPIFDGNHAAFFASNAMTVFTRTDLGWERDQYSLQAIAPLGLVRCSGSGQIILTAQNQSIYVVSPNAPDQPRLLWRPSSGVSSSFRFTRCVISATGVLALSMEDFTTPDGAVMLLPLEAPSKSFGMNFGRALAVRGPLLVVSAPGWINDETRTRGSLFLYDLDHPDRPAGIITPPRWAQLSEWPEAVDALRLVGLGANDEDGGPNLAFLGDSVAFIDQRELAVTLRPAPLVLFFQVQATAGAYLTGVTRLPWGAVPSGGPLDSHWLRLVGARGVLLLGRPERVLATLGGTGQRACEWWLLPRYRNGSMGAEPRKVPGLLGFVSAIDQGAHLVLTTLVSGMSAAVTFTTEANLSAAIGIELPREIGMMTTLHGSAAAASNTWTTGCTISSVVTPVGSSPISPTAGGTYRVTISGCATGCTASNVLAHFFTSEVCGSSPPATLLMYARQCSGTQYLFDMVPRSSGSCTWYFTTPTDDGTHQFLSFAVTVYSGMRVVHSGSNWQSPIGSPVDVSVPVAVVSAGGSVTMDGTILPSGACRAFVTAYSVTGALASCSELAGTWSIHENGVPTTATIDESCHGSRTLLSWRCSSSLADPSTFDFFSGSVRVAATVTAPLINDDITPALCSCSGFPTVFYLGQTYTITIACTQPPVNDPLRCSTLPEEAAGFDAILATAGATLNTVDTGCDGADHFRLNIKPATGEGPVDLEVKYRGRSLGTTCHLPAVPWGAKVAAHRCTYGSSNTYAHVGTIIIWSVSCVDPAGTQLQCVDAPESLSQFEMLPSVHGTDPRPTLVDITCGPWSGTLYWFRWIAAGPGTTMNVLYRMVPIGPGALDNNATVEYPIEAYRCSIVTPASLLATVGEVYTVTIHCLQVILTVQQKCEDYPQETFNFVVTQANPGSAPLRTTWADCESSTHDFRLQYIPMSASPNLAAGAAIGVEYKGTPLPGNFSLTLESPLDASRCFYYADTQTWAHTGTIITTTAQCLLRDGTLQSCSQMPAETANFNLAWVGGSPGPTLLDVGCGPVAGDNYKIRWVANAPGTALSVTYRTVKIEPGAPTRAMNITYPVEASRCTILAPSSTTVALGAVAQLSIRCLQGDGTTQQPCEDFAQELHNFAVTQTGAGSTPLRLAFADCDTASHNFRLGYVALSASGNTSTIGATHRGAALSGAFTMTWQATTPSSIAAARCGYASTESRAETGVISTTVVRCVDLDGSTLLPCTAFPAEVANFGVVQTGGTTSPTLIGTSCVAATGHYAVQWRANDPGTALSVTYLGTKIGAGAPEHYMTLEVPLASSRCIYATSPSWAHTGTAMTTTVTCTQWDGSTQGCQGLPAEAANFGIFQTGGSAAPTLVDVSCAPSGDFQVRWIANDPGTALSVTYRGVKIGPAGADQPVTLLDPLEASRCAILAPASTTVALGAVAQLSIRCLQGDGTTQQPCEDFAQELHNFAVTQTGAGSTPLRLAFADCDTASHNFRLGYVALSASGTTSTIGVTHRGAALGGAFTMTWQVVSGASVTWEQYDDPVDPRAHWETIVRVQCTGGRTTTPSSIAAARCAYASTESWAETGVISTTVVRCVDLDGSTLLPCTAFLAEAVNFGVVQTGGTAGPTLIGTSCVAATGHYAVQWRANDPGTALSVTYRGTKIGPTVADRSVTLLDPIEASRCTILAPSSTTVALGAVAQLSIRCLQGDGTTQQPCEDFAQELHNFAVTQTGAGSTPLRLAFADCDTASHNFRLGYVALSASGNTSTIGATHRGAALSGAFTMTWQATTPSSIAAARCGYASTESRAETGVISTTVVRCVDLDGSTLLPCTAFPAEVANFGVVQTGGTTSPTLIGTSCVAATGHYAVQWRANDPGTALSVTYLGTKIGAGAPEHYMTLEVPLASSRCIYATSPSWAHRDGHDHDSHLHPVGWLNPGLPRAACRSQLWHFQTGGSAAPTLVDVSCAPSGDFQVRWIANDPGTALSVTYRGVKIGPAGADQPVTLLDPLEASRCAILAPASTTVALGAVAQLSIRCLQGDGTTQQPCEDFAQELHNFAVTQTGAGATPLRLAFADCDTASHNFRLGYVALSASGTTSTIGVTHRGAALGGGAFTMTWQVHSQPGPLHVNTTTVSWPNGRIVTARQPLQFTIAGRDLAGAAVSCPDRPQEALRLAVSLSPSGGLSRTDVAFGCQSDEGTTASNSTVFVGALRAPSLAGLYNFTLLYRGLPLALPPSSVTVLPGPVHAPSSELRFDTGGPSSARVGSLFASAWLDARDLDGNSIACNSSVPVGFTAELWSFSFNGSTSVVTPADVTCEGTRFRVAVVPRLPGPALLSVTHVSTQSRCPHLPITVLCPVDTPMFCPTTGVCSNDTASCLLETVPQPASGSTTVMTISLYVFCALLLVGLVALAVVQRLHSWNSRKSPPPPPAVPSSPVSEKPPGQPLQLFATTPAEPASAAVVVPNPMHTGKDADSVEIAPPHVVESRPVPAPVPVAISHPGNHRPNQPLVALRRVDRKPLAQPPPQPHPSVAPDDPR
ncbi:hypothetical protein PAPYR_10421 [Paratrimastix pyriformis]|uniref:Uncharacterized protein n=1 Tax=Paratrimastix pyriformis TaxID=342808 RepID=A0ABQ8U9S0_9EUKA|nr:hypothetical protein PAPYR_10421 [Paratrimastix pyriformis]